MTTLTPLLTPNGRTVCDKFSTDLADLCNAASQSGMTPNMITGQLWNMAMLVGFQVKDDIDAMPATTQSSATLTISALSTPPSDMQVLALALGPYSLELKYTAHDGFTYTAGTLWPGVTLYGKAGDMMRLTAVSDTMVAATISQDGGVTWTPFTTYPRTEVGPLQVKVTSTTYAVVTP